MKNINRNDRVKVLEAVQAVKDAQASLQELIQVIGKQMKVDPGQFWFDIDTLRFLPKEKRSVGFFADCQGKAPEFRIPQSRPEKSGQST